MKDRLPETLTVLSLEVPPTLARTLRSTNAIESMISICRERKQREELAERADGTALVRRRMIEASKQFRRVNGHLHLPALRDALQRHAATTTVPADCYKDHVA